MRPASSFPARAQVAHVRGTLVLVGVLALVAPLAGCASSEYVKLRSVPKSPLVEKLKLTSRGGPRPSPRTVQLLRQYDLVGDLKRDHTQLLTRLQAAIDREPTAEKLYSFAELSYLAGKKMEVKNPAAALDHYGAAVTHAYLYLFDERFAPLRNPYDPQFRGACDLYNGALECALRIMKRQGALVPGRTHAIQSASQVWNVTVVAVGAGWKPEDFERFEFVSDYEVQGLTNQYQSFGLGVPLIAVRKRRPQHVATEQFYPPELSFPVTAFLRVLPGGTPPAGVAAPQPALLELYDPLASTDILVGGRRVPLESDLSTPLAYFLNDPRLNELGSPTAGLLWPDQSRAITGLYMLEPYEPGKIPVLMVHGLWSNPLTWMEMFNDLRSVPEIRSRYQFWFYLYPTGGPFWESAATLREELAEVRWVVDPDRRDPALDQMVLVGHSMGGLVSKLQTIESGDDFWNVVSDKPFQAVQALPEVRYSLANTFFFRPNPSIRRVITIGTPHRGSRFANDATRWLAQKFISLPRLPLVRFERLYRDNPGALGDASLFTIKTSIDSLATDSPILPVMLEARRPPWVKYHNIVGVLSDQGWLGSVAGGTDGVVSYASAHLDDVASELAVDADHSTLHRHPLSVLEVRRILLEHLAQPDAGEQGGAARDRTAGKYVTPPAAPPAPPRRAGSAAPSVPASGARGG